MSSKAQITKSTLIRHTLGVLISTPRSYIDLNNAIKHFKYYLDNYIDEPIILLYLITDTNALAICKSFSGLKLAITKEELKDIPRNCIIELYYHHGYCGNNKSFSEILCGRLKNFFTIDTKLKVDYDKS